MKTISLTAFIIGILLMLLGAVLASFSATAYLQAEETSWSQWGNSFEGTGIILWGGMLAGFVGMLLTLINELLLKFKYQYQSIWMVLLSFGLVYCIPFIFCSIYPTYKELQYPLIHPDSHYDIGELFIACIPGLIIILASMILRFIPKNILPTVQH